MQNVDFCIVTKLTDSQADWKPWDVLMRSKRRTAGHSSITQYNGCHWLVGLECHIYCKKLHLVATAVWQADNVQLPPPPSPCQWLPLMHCPIKQPTALLEKQTKLKFINLLFNTQHQVCCHLSLFSQLITIHNQLPTCGSTGNHKK